MWYNCCTCIAYLELVGNFSNVCNHDNLLFCLPAGLHVHPSSPQEHPVCLKMPIPSECIKLGWALFFFLSVSAFNHKRASTPYHVYSDSMPLHTDVEISAT